MVFITLIFITWYSLLDIHYLIFITWYSLLDIHYLIFITWHSLLDIHYLIFITWYSLLDIHYLIFITWYSLLEIQYFDIHYLIFITWYSWFDIHYLIFITWYSIFWYSVLDIHYFDVMADWLFVTAIIQKVVTTNIRMVHMKLHHFTLIFHYKFQVYYPNDNHAVNLIARYKLFVTEMYYQLAYATNEYPVLK